MLSQKEPRRRKRLVYYSRYAFYRPHYTVFESLCKDYDLDGFVITIENAEVWKVYSPEGHFTPASAGLSGTPDFVTVLPCNISLQEQTQLLRRKLKEIRPDFIWSDEEPNSYFVNQMLRWYFWQESPCIVIGAIENMWSVPGGYRAKLELLRRRILWSRYNGVLAVASKSLEAVRRFGVPTSVPGRVAWLPVLPHESSNGVPHNILDRSEGDFLILFAGRITAAKGWRVLLAAMTMLPEKFKCLISGTGDEEAELRLWCETTSLRNRVRFLGVLPNHEMWGLYRAVDVFVLPSLTTLLWTEQFGRVLAEAMACGVPVIGSSSGAIPEVIGDCGVIVEENNPSAIAKAIKELAADPGRRAALGKKGHDRFEQHFSCKAYVAQLAAALGVSS